MCIKQVMKPLLYNAFFQFKLPLFAHISISDLLTSFCYSLFSSQIYYSPVCVTNSYVQTNYAVLFAQLLKFACSLQ
jgi:hypothetical protein